MNTAVEIMPMMFKPAYLMKFLRTLSMSTSETERFLCVSSDQYEGKNREEQDLTFPEKSWHRSSGSSKLSGGA